MNSNVKVLDLQRTFVPPPRFSSSRPRSVELTASGRALTAMAFCLFAAAIGAGILLSREAQRDASRYRAFLERGVTTTGYVTRLREGGDDDERRRVGYRFSVDGGSYDAEGQVSSDRRRTLRVGSEVPVRYVADNPRISRVGTTAGGAGMPLWAPFVVATGIAAIGVSCLLGIHRQRHLLSEGRAAPALVTAVKSQSGSHGTHRSITYDFPLMSGAVTSGKSGTSSKPPAVGSVICIVYDPEQPKRNQVYPFGLVRPQS